MSRRSVALVALMAATACSKPALEIAAPMEAGTLRAAAPIVSLLFARTIPVALARTSDHHLRVLSLTDGKELTTIDFGDRKVGAMDFAPNATAIAAGDWTGLVSVWAADSGKLRFEHRLSKYPGVLTFSPDGRRLAAAAQGEAVQILDAETGAPVATLGSPVGGTAALAFSRDGRLVATGDADTVIRVYDAATGKELASNREFLMVPLAIAFSADGALVFAASGDKFVTVVDATTGRTSRKLDRTNQPVMGLDLSPDGKSIVTIFMKSEDMTQPDHIVVRSLETWQPQLDWLPPSMPVAGGWTSDGRLLVGLASKDGLQLWRLR